MIQLNLLPDIKKKYIKAQRQRRFVASISVLVTIVAVMTLVLLLLVDAAQKKHLSDLSRDISAESSSLQNKPQITKVLTVQNQLESLTALHAAKPAAARLFDNFLNELTPAAVTISHFNIDFTAQTATITGAADSLSSVNKYVDTLKLTTYTTSSNSTKSLAFSNIVLSSFALSPTAGSQAANYTVTFSYDKNIFDITQNTVNLSVPNLVATHDGAQPNSLFSAAPSTARSGGGQ